MPLPDPPQLQMLDPHLRKVVLIIGYMIIVAGAAYALSVAWPVIESIISVLLPFLVALIVAYILNPIVTFLSEKLRLGKIAGLGVFYLLVLLVFAIFLGMVVPNLIRQSKAAYVGITQTVPGKVKTYLEGQGYSMDDFWFAADQLLHEFGIIQKLPIIESEGDQPPRPEAGTEAGPLSLPGLEPESGEDDKEPALFGGAEDSDELTTRSILRRLEGDDPEKVTAPDPGQATPGSNATESPDPVSKSFLQRAAESDGLKETAATAARGGIAVVGTVLRLAVLLVVKILGSITFVVFVILISCYFILDFAKFRGLLEILIPDKVEARVFSILDKCDTAVGGYLRGQLISAFLVGVLVFLGLLFLGMAKYAMLIALIAMVGNLIPYLGPVLAGTPAVLYQLFNDDYETFQQRILWTGGTALMFIIVQQIDGFIFQPKIVGKGAQLHPVVVLLALIAGAKFGIMGMIVAVPVASIARVLLKEFYWDEREKKWTETTGKRRLDDPERRQGGKKRAENRPA